MSKSLGMALCFSVLALARPASAVVNSVAGQADAIGNLGVSARAVGMGSAFVGVADDSSALLWNPAGLAGLGAMEFALHHNSWLAGIVQETFVGALPLGSLGTFGASLNYVNYGSLAGYDEVGNPTSAYSPSRYGFGLGWAHRIVRGLSAGLAVHGSVQQVDEKGYGDVSADLGALWTPLPGLRVGLSYANLGTPVSGYGLATALRLGGSYLLGLSAENSLLVAASGAIEPGGVNRLQLGLEDSIHSMLFLRLGYQMSLAETQIEGLSGMSAGAGVLYRRVSLDYAFLPFGDLGGAHRISLGYRFQRP